MNLMERGASEEDLAKLSSENALRVWEENERTAARLSAISRPNEASWSDRIWKETYFGLPYSKLDGSSSIQRTDHMHVAVFSDSKETRSTSERGAQSKTGIVEEV